MAYNISGTEKKIILHSPSMIQIFQKANLLAYNQASVLIYGESGVGKSFLAEYIQKSGALSGKPFVKISCSAISEELLPLSFSAILPTPLPVLLPVEKPDF